MRVPAAALLFVAVLAGTALAVPRPPAPPIAGATVQGPRASLAELRGRPVFVNVWSSW